MASRSTGNVVDANEVAARLQQARININTLLGDDAVRADLRGIAVESIRAELARAHVPADQIAARAERLADARLAELRAKADSKGFISGTRAREVFVWIDKFDTNGSGASIDVYNKASGTEAPTLTYSARVYQHVLASTQRAARFTEEEFVAGFMNGQWSPQRLRDLPEPQKVALQKAGVYDLLMRRLRDSNVPQELSGELLSRVFRAMDNQVDTDGNGATMTAFGPQADAQPDAPFPVPSRAAAPNETYEAMLALRSLFDVAGQPTEPDQARSDTGLVPPPAANLEQSPLAGRDRPLAGRRDIDQSAFKNYTRDAVIKLNAIPRDSKEWEQIQAALRAANIPVSELESIAPNRPIGDGADRVAAGAQMDRLQALLARPGLGGHNGIIQPWRNNAVGTERTGAGHILDILDRYTERFNLSSVDELTNAFGGGRFDPSRITPAIAEQLNRAGVDPIELAKKGRNGEEVARFIFASLTARGGDNVAPGMRPSTIALGVTRSGRYQESDAGRIMNLVRNNLLANFDQQFHTYAGGGEALVDRSVRPVHIRTTFSGYDPGDEAGCFRRAGESVESSGRVQVDGGANHYLARDANNVFATIRAQGDDLRAGRRFIDAMLDQGIPSQIAVIRRGGPGRAIGNPGTGVYHSVMIDQRSVDPETGRVSYSGWDNATMNERQGRVTFFVDPKTNLLYAPPNGGPVALSRGGYQMTMVHLPSRIRPVNPGAQPFPGTSRAGDGWLAISRPQEFFRHFAEGNIQGPMRPPPPAVVGHSRGTRSHAA